MNRNQDLEIVTETLSRDQMLREIDLSRETLGSSQVDRVIVEYGWGANLDPSLLWQPQDIALNELSEFVAAAEAAGIYRIGAADLIVRDTDDTFMLLFCHESDVHLHTTSATLSDEVMKKWRSREIRVRKKTQSGEWTVT
jgi:hypothetical protein